MKIKKKKRENQQKFEKRLEEEEKSTFRAFASPANKHVNINRHLYKNDGECKYILQGNC